MPAFVAPLVGFALGALLAWARPPAGPRPMHTAQAAPPPHGQAADRRPLALAALFSLLVFAPICAYFLVFAPDWSLAYLIDSRRVPSAVDLLLVLVDAASVPAGFLAFERVAARRSLRALGALLGVPLALAALGVLVFAGRLSLDGTYRQVHGDFGVRPVAGGPLGYALLWMAGLLVAGFALTVRAIRGGGELPAQVAPGDASRRPLRPGASPGPRALPRGARSPSAPRAPAEPPDTGERGRSGDPRGVPERGAAPPRRRLGGG